MASHDAGKTWSGGERVSVVGNDRTAVFTIGFQGSGERKVPERLKQYGNKRKTAEELAQKQRQAEERKKKHDEEKVRQARKVREEAIAFDKKFSGRLSKQGADGGGKKWFSHALKKK